MFKIGTKIKMINPVSVYYGSHGYIDYISEAKAPGSYDCRVTFPETDVHGYLCDFFELEEIKEPEIVKLPNKLIIWLSKRSAK